MMKQKKLKSLLAFLLVLCMAFSVQPGIALAQEEDDTVVQSGDPDTVTDTTDETDDTKVNGTNDGTGSTDTTDTADTAVKGGATTDTGKGASKLKRNIAPTNTEDDPDEGIAPQTNDPITGSCGATEADNVTWTLEQNNTDSDNPTYTLAISGSGNMMDFTVTSSEDNRPWKNNADSITKVEISEGITSIGDSAFRNLASLIETNIPASITDLGDHIYRDDTSLVTVNWASGFQAPTVTDTDSNATTYTGTYVPTSMFDGCTSLGSELELSAWLPESFTGVGCAAFRGTAFRVDFEKWTNLNYIGTYGFAAMKNLDGAITVKSSWIFGLRGTTNTSGAFNGSGVTSVNIESRETIPYGIFQNCASLNSVTLADNTKTIEQYAFLGTTSLKNIDLKNVETVSGYAFDNSGLTELTLPENLKVVEGRAFRGNKNLTRLVINSSELEIKGAFMGCSNLAYVETKEGTKVRFNNAFNAGSQSGETACTGITKLVANGTISGSITALTGLKELSINGESETGLTQNSIPSSVELLTITGDQWVIGSTYAFSKAAAPKNLIVTADTVNSKDDTVATFRSDLTLETAQFTGSNVSLNNNMFMGCANLKQLDLSEVTNLTIGTNCFADDTNTTHTGGQINHFNQNCYIYVADSDNAATVRKNTGLAAGNGIVLAVNGGTVKMGEPGFDSVTKKNHYAEWYDNADFTGTAVAAAEAGKTYYAKWIPKTDTTITINDNVSLSRTYDGKAVSLSANDYTVTGDNRTITFSYQIKENGEWKDIDSAPKDAGEYRVKAVVAENEDYASAESTYKEFIISKATPDYTAPTDLTAIIGQTLADVKLPDGFTWQDDGTTSVGNAGTHTFKATYTPADTGNYNAVEDIKVTLNVYPKAEILNAAPSITATDKTLTVGDTFDPLNGVSASDTEDGNLTDKITVESNTVDTAKAGTYTVTYKVTDSKGASCTKTVYITVNPKMEALNEVPVINAKNKTITVGDTFDAKANVTATDKEDGDITKDIKVINNTVDTSKAGIYEVTYKVTDSQEASVTKTITVTVKEKDVQKPTTDDNKKPSKTDTDKKPANAGKTTSNSPKTGDNTNMTLWGALVILSGGLLAVIIGIKRKRKLEK